MTKKKVIKKIPLMVIGVLVLAVIWIFAAWKAEDIYLYHLLSDELKNTESDILIGYVNTNGPFNAMYTNTINIDVCLKNIKGLDDEEAQKQITIGLKDVESLDKKTANEVAKVISEIRNTVQSYIALQSVSKYHTVSNFKLEIHFYPRHNVQETVMSFTNRYNPYRSGYHAGEDQIFEETNTPTQKLDSVQAWGTLLNKDNIQYFSDCKSLYLANYDEESFEDKLEDFSFLKDFKNLKCIYISSIVVSNGHSQELEECKKFLPLDCTLYFDQYDYNSYQQAYVKKLYKTTV